MENVFTNLKTAKALQDSLNRFTEGEVIFCTEEDSYYFFGKDGFEPFEIDTTKDIAKSFSAPQMTLFEINQQIISQLPNLTTAELGQKKAEINNFHLNKQSNYYMLLCKEISYFTIFEFTNREGDFDSFGKGVLACLIEGVGTVVSVDVLEDEVEIWVRDDQGEVNCFHLFDYSQGIVTIGR